MTSVFISRNLDPESPFRLLLQEAGFRVFGQSLIEFSAVTFDCVPNSDWIFFYSPKTVDFFFNQLPSPISTATAYGAMGKGTASRLQQYGIVPSFVGSGVPNATAEAFELEASGKIVLFPQARQSRQSIQNLLKSRITAIDLVVYDNQPLVNFDIPRCDWLVFTSPLNAKSYFARYELQAQQQILTIGSTTQEAIRNLGVKDVHTVAKPTEVELANFIINA